MNGIPKPSSEAFKEIPRHEPLLKDKLKKAHYHFATQHHIEGAGQSIIPSGEKSSSGCHFTVIVTELVTTSF